MTQIDGDRKAWGGDAVYASVPLRLSRVSGGGGIPGERSQVAGSGTPRPLVVAQCARAVTLEGMRERALFETVP